MRVGTSRTINIVLILLQGYFALMNVTVERCYCHDPLSPTDTRFLMPETFQFARDHNPLFLSRPRWMQLATCVSAYAFLPFYLLIAFAAVSGWWAACSMPINCFVGAKMYAICFYHLMEFTSEQPPPNLVPYLSVEGPYLLSIALVLVQLGSLTPPSGGRPKTA